MKKNPITRRAFTLSFITLAALALTAIVGCSTNESLPTEFKLTRVLHQKKVSQLMGPGGGIIPLLSTNSLRKSQQRLRIKV